MDGVCDMTSVVLLEQLKAFTEKIMSDMILPVAMQQGDTEQAYRAPEVYLMRLPDSRAAKKKAPYIIHRVIPLATEQQPGNEERTIVSVRSIFCCYNPGGRPCAPEHDGAFPGGAAESPQGGRCRS